MDSQNHIYCNWRHLYVALCILGIAALWLVLTASTHERMARLSRR